MIGLGHHVVARHARHARELADAAQHALERHLELELVARARPAS